MDEFYCICCAFPIVFVGHDSLHKAYGQTKGLRLRMGSSTETDKPRQALVARSFGRRTGRRSYPGPCR